MRFIKAVHVFFLLLAAIGEARKIKPYNLSNYVTVCNEGNQLGGQLTTYAVVLGYAWANGITPYFDREKLVSAPGGKINYEHIFHRLPQNLPMNVDPKEPLHLGYYPNRAPHSYRKGNVCICGMPNNPLDYFHKFRSRIRELYAPSDELLSRLRGKYSAIIDHPKTVAVHVRTYTPGLQVHWCLGADYFKRAMDYFSDDHLFIVFSDRISWCKQNLGGRNVVFIEGNSHIEDLYLMSLCKNIITSNSTFSWWAAYLKKDEDGLILVPEKWFPNEDPNERRAFYPAHYKTLSVGEVPAPSWDLFQHATTSLGD